MYPFLRLAKEFLKFRNAPSLDVHGEHVSTHICWPWDLDFAAELNNGRTLTLFDLGRIVMAKRMGLLSTIRREGWFMTMAGATVRYRRRVPMFTRLTMRSRVAWWDERFFYLEQSMWLTNGECANHAVYRAAVADKNGIVNTARVAAAMGYTGQTTQAPDWIAKWAEAEALRPWPPMQD